MGRNDRFSPRVSHAVASPELFRHRWVVDVEGAELALFHSIDHDRFSFGVLIVEVDVMDRSSDEDRALRHAIHCRGYVLAGTFCNNDVWINPKIDWAVAGAEKMASSPRKSQIQLRYPAPQMACFDVTAMGAG